MAYFDEEINRTYTFKRYALNNRNMETLYYDCTDIYADEQQSEYMLEVGEFDALDSWFDLDVEDTEYVHRQFVRDLVNAVMAEAKELDLDYVEFV